ncbi:hypothetical protein [Sphingomonas sp. OK281]|uniref:hypothetical protein n=1 Tax=Sphingomonas sp. OK281 TaxID=1881067 RepID=UPI001113CDF4|nr:hypothetical protein [Sphingomonas sp. OK281]
MNRKRVVQAVFTHLAVFILPVPAQALSLFVLAPVPASAKSDLNCPLNIAIKRLVPAPENMLRKLLPGRIMRPYALAPDEGVIQFVNGTRGAYLGGFVAGRRTEFDYRVERNKVYDLNNLTGFFRIFRNK